jgi:hypothetical protein
MSDISLSHRCFFALPRVFLYKRYPSLSRQAARESRNKRMQAMQLEARLDFVRINATMGLIQGWRWGGILREPRKTTSDGAEMKAKGKKAIHLAAPGAGAYISTDLT